MPLNPLFTVEQLPTTSAAAIREFQDRYLAVLGASKPNGWADTLGETIPTKGGDVTFPLSQMRTKFKRAEGEEAQKKFAETSFRIKTEEFEDGYQARLMDLFLNVFAYKKWSEGPAKLVLAEEQHRHTSVAQLLDGDGTRGSGPQGGLDGTCVDGKAFFATDHPANMVDSKVAGTWSNYQSSAKDPTKLSDLEGEVVSMQSGVLDENGVLLGANPKTILVAADYAERVTNILAKELILDTVPATGSTASGAATSNPFKGRFKVVPVKEFTIASGSTADWYLVDEDLIIRQGFSPWAILHQTVPQSLALRVFDESAAFFKSTVGVKIDAHTCGGVGVGLAPGDRR